MGDTGASGALELQMPNLFGWSKRAGQMQLYPVVFFDAGEARLLAPLQGEPEFVDIRSAGAGLEFAIFDMVYRLAVLGRSIGGGQSYAGLSKSLGNSL